MVEKDAVSKDFRKQVLGLRADNSGNRLSPSGSPLVAATYVRQDYDLFPNFPALKDFPAFWEKSLEGPLFVVTVAHSKLIKPPNCAPSMACFGCIDSTRAIPARARGGN
jgi:uncharacterized protein Usg